MALSARYPCEHFASAEEFLARDDSDREGCVLIDASLPGMSAIELIRTIRASESALPVLVVSDTPTVAIVVKCMKLGAFDFLPLPVEPAAFAQAIAAAFEHNRVQRHNRLEAEVARKRLKSLTPREVDILKILAQGKTTQQIANQTQLSTKTVSNHRAHLLAKTNSDNTAGLVRLALLAGIAAE